MKNGLIMENGELIYYQDDQPVHAGAIKVGRDIYYISSGGKAVKGEHIVHREMTNGILKRGTYTFGEDGRLIRGSYVAPKETKGKKNVKARITKGIVLALSGILLTVLLIVAIGDLIDEHQKNNTNEDKGSYYDENTAKAIWPSFQEEVLLCSPTALAVSNGEVAFTPSLARSDAPYVSAKFEYRLINCTGTLLLGETQELVDAVRYDLQTGAHMLELHNLKTDTTYYYRAESPGGTETGSFHTAKSPRFLYVEGMSNLRDIGGFKNLEGKTVKQGMLIRGCEPDGLVEPQYLLTDDSISVLRDTFKFSHQLDLRSPATYTGDYRSRLGTNVTHRFYGAPQYGQVFSEVYHESLRNIFTDLADPTKYPIYMHCTHGADRTGTLIFLLQGVLNMDQEDMIREYQRTGYTHPQYADSPQMDVLIQGLASYDGTTVQDKICTFLTTEVGVTEAELDSIRNILLEN